MASLICRSAAGRLLQRSIPQGSFSRSPGRFLYDGAERIQINKHYSSKPNMGHTKTFEDEKRICQCSGSQMEFQELASGIRSIGDKVRLLEKTYDEAERLDRQRGRVLICTSVLLIATYFVFG